MATRLLCCCCPGMHRTSISPAEDSDTRANAYTSLRETSQKAPQAAAAKIGSEGKKERGHTKIITVAFSTLTPLQRANLLKKIQDQQKVLGQKIGEIGNRNTFGKKGQQTLQGVASKKVSRLLTCQGVLQRHPDSKPSQEEEKRTWQKINQVTGYSRARGNQKPPRVERLWMYINKQMKQ